MSLATSLGDVATPFEFVSTTLAPLNDALGPDAGKLKVTSAFGTTLLPASRTVACRAL